MTDRDERGDEVTNRMARRFEGDETAEQSETSETSKPSELEKPAEPSERDEQDDQSVKDERSGTYMYLPESQKDRMKRQYNYLKADYEIEFEDDLEKNRHFYPLVAECGLDSLEDMSPSDVRETLNERGWL